MECIDLKSGTGVIIISGEWANVKVLMALRDADDSVVRGSQGEYDFKNSLANVGNEKEKMLEK